MSPAARKYLPAVAALILIAAAAIYWYRDRQAYRLEALLARLPVSDAAVVHIDFAALRAAGAMKFLSGTAAEMERDYTDFVEQTGFDYRRDLDLALVSLHPSGSFFLVRGRFDWPRLENFARKNQGSCYRSLCRMAGSKPERRISFFPLRRDLMALAVSSDEFAASRLDAPAAAPASIPAPTQPVWIHLTPGSLRDPERFPEGTKLIAKALEISTGTTLAAGMGAGGGFEVSLDAVCQDERSAETLASTLERITTLLNTLLRRESQQPSAGDLAAVLSSGKFRRDGKRALGTWQVSPDFLEGLLDPAVRKK